MATTTTTKNEMTQIQAMCIIVDMLNEGTIQVNEDVKVKVNEVLVAMQKRKDNKKKKEASDTDVANMQKIVDYLATCEGDSVSNIINKAHLVTEDGMALSTSKCTSLLKTMEEVERVEINAKKAIYRLKAEV